MIINCECGYVARGDHDAVMADLNAQIARDHPEMVGRHEREELLDLVEET